jgi:2-polyprenyl-3-methyl-5-hydroxy-6-metoxy-1,4-benzoquinol methylase
VIDLFYQRSTARGKQKNDIRLRILDVGRKVGIVSNNIATVRRKLEKIVKGHAI